MTFYPMNENNDDDSAFFIGQFIILETSLN